MIDIDKILELEARCPPYHLIYDHHVAYMVIGVDEVDVSRRNAELIVSMRENIRQLCLELKAAREVINAATSVQKYLYENGKTSPNLRFALEEYDEATNGR